MKAQQEDIVIRGARVNNLKDIHLTLPRGQWTVITGVSGSGKSSLAFDTLYAEGRRRYVESLSAYARQFLGKIPKPDVDSITGLPPAIAIEQKTVSRNPRSTVGTSTEIYDYIRLLYGRVGHTFSPVTGKEVTRHTAEDVVRAALAYPAGTRVAIAAPIEVPEGRTLDIQLGIYLKEGYTRVINRQGDILSIATLLSDEGKKELKALRQPLLLIDRLSVSDASDEISRMTDSAETAFYEGHGACSLLVWAEGKDKPIREDFSERFEADGITFIVPDEALFNFNNPYGACPECEGFGKTMGIDERLVVPNPSLSIYEDAVACWRGEKLSEWKRELIHLAPNFGFPIHTPYNELTDEQRSLLWHGNSRWEGIDGFFRMVDANQYKIQYRVLRARYRGRTVCPACHGTRLRPEAQYVKVAGRSIHELVSMPVQDLAVWMDNLQLSEHDALIAERILREIRSRLGFLVQVGLGYLTLDRLSNTLSGGESQRINLATSLGSPLVGSLYVLDEPSIGLHPRDTGRLISVLQQLKQQGNTVVVVEHDEDIIRAADRLVDVGPDAGRLGGEIVYQGPLPQNNEALAKDTARSYTMQYLGGQLEIPVPKARRRSSSHIRVVGACEHNLKNITVDFPLGVMTVVTGVSGSGKSTLVRDILYRAMARKLDIPEDAPGAFARLDGDVNRIGAIEFVDQNPIGRSTRSNPATYLKAFDEIRKLMAAQQAAVQMGFTPAHFSFNAEGGRCEECKGDGYITVEMQFMADITIPCEACHGMRYKRDILEVRYRERNIHDILEMTIQEAMDFFSADPDATAQRIVARLRPLADVGLGYIKLGQNSSSLSGGENQRVKLAYFLGMEQPTPTMFIFDEPTTGLHFNDIKTLLRSLDRLLAKGHTVVIIEHNLEVIKMADHIIDIGLEGGEHGGTVVITGTPEQVAACPDSHTARYLAPKLNEK